MRYGSFLKHFSCYQLLLNRALVSLIKAKAVSRGRSSPVMLCKFIRPVWAEMNWLKSCQFILSPHQVLMVF